MSTTYSFYPLTGGIDQSSPVMSVQAGSAFEAVNFEPDISGGFRRIVGYERFDGQQSPSRAAFTVVEVADSSALSVGDALVGGTSGATGTLAAKFGNTLLVSAFTGEFVYGEVVNGTTVVDPSTLSVELTPELSAQYKYAVADYCRSLIQVVPGTGQIRGVCSLGDTVYAWRDSGSACVLYKSTVSGWQAVTTYHHVKYDTGVTEFVVGETIITATGTAVVKRVIRNTGTWSGGDAAGYLVVEVTSGSIIDGEAINDNGATLRATATSDSTAIGWTAGGRFSCIRANFSADQGGFAIYATNGLDAAVEIRSDGLITPMLSAATNDIPTLCEIHENRLFLGFENGAIQFSVAGEPHNFSVLLGAGEIHLGDVPTGLLSQPGGLIIAASRKTYLLAGSSVADFALQVASDSTGAYKHTLQSMSRIYALDDRGIISLDRVQAFGNFEAGSLSRTIQRLVDYRKVSVTASTVMRGTNQYRLYFSDKSAFACYPLNTDKGVSFMATVLNYPVPVLVTWNNEDDLGFERAFFGSTDGYVYEDQRGTSFDGAEIEAWINLNYNHLKSPQTRKRFRRAVFDITGSGFIRLNITQDLSYSDNQIPAARTITKEIIGGSGYWDFSNWNQFNWDASVVAQADMKLYGMGRNISFLLHTDSNLIEPFTVQGITVHYESRRLQR